MFTVICDGCGADVCEGEDFSAYADRPAIESIALDSGWMENKGNHYCPDCWSYDEDDDLVFKSINKTP